MRTKGKARRGRGKNELFQNEWFEGNSNNPSGSHMRCGSVLITIFELKAAWLKYQITYITTRTSQCHLTCHLFHPGYWPDYVFVSAIEINVILF
jgi:hypothetical protein